MYTVYFPEDQQECIDFYQEDPVANKIVEIAKEYTDLEIEEILYEVRGDSLSVPKERLGVSYNTIRTRKS